MEGHIQVCMAETNITVGQWTKSEQKQHVTDHAVSQSGKMAGRKSTGTTAARASESPLFPSASMSSTHSTAP